MCAVSNVVGPWTTPMDPNYIPWTKQLPTPDTAAQILDVIRRLEALDKKLGAIECKLEEAEKEKFKKKLRRRAGKSK